MHAYTFSLVAAKQADSSFLGGILTVADDLLKNDGKKFIEMMEQLAERRMQREEEAQFSAHPNMQHRSYTTHSHNAPPPADDDDDYDDEGEDDDDYDDDEYDEDEDDEEVRNLFYPQLSTRLLATNLLPPGHHD